MFLKLEISLVPTEETRSQHFMKNLLTCPDSIEQCAENSTDTAFVERQFQCYHF